jgi:hypothetical protein
MDVGKEVYRITTNSLSPVSGTVLDFDGMEYTVRTGNPEFNGAPGTMTRTEKWPMGDVYETPSSAYAGISKRCKKLLEEADNILRQAEKRYEQSIINLEKYVI